MKWTDTTSYSRGKRGKEEPTTWDLKASGLRLCVHRYHGYEGWYVTSHDVGIERRALKATTLEEAQAEGVGHVRAHLRLMLKRLDDATKSNTEETKP